MRPSHHRLDLLKDEKEGKEDMKHATVCDCKSDSLGFFAWGANRLSVES